MARIFITGSAGGLGKLAANALIHLGHQVVLHARNHQRSANYLSKADDISTQEQFLTRCEQLSGVRFPAPSQ